MLRVLTAYEIAVLYYGHERLLHDVQEAQVQRLVDGHKLPPGTRSQVELAHLARMRLDGGLDWLAHDDPVKAKAVATHLAGLPDERARRVADEIHTKLTQPAGDNARS